MISWCVVCCPAGKWRWELQQRYQYLLRQHTAAGKDTAPLAAAYEACVAAALREKEQQSKETGDQYMRVFGGGWAVPVSAAEDPAAAL